MTKSMTLYIAASGDNIVPPHNVSEITRVRPSVKVVTIAGPHLAVYTNPQSAAQAIVTFIAEVATIPGLDEE